MTVHGRARFSLVGLGCAAVLLVAAPAAAQDADELVGNVQISFDVGDFDSELGDWTIEAVEVTGDLTEGEPFTVDVLGSGDTVLWSATQPYSGAEMRIPVTAEIAVAEVESAGVSQARPIVGGVVIERPEVDWSSSGGGGSGQLALSMVMAVIIVAIVFRTPMPSATTQRWTR